MKKNQKGITIIVLLILAGVSIAMLRGDNGIVTNASNAKSKSGIAEAKESIGIAINSVNSETETQRVEDSNWDPQSAENDKTLTAIFVKDLGGEKEASKYHTDLLKATGTEGSPKDSLKNLAGKILIYSVNGKNYEYVLTYSAETGYYSVEFLDTDSEENISDNVTTDWGSEPSRD